MPPLNSGRVVSAHTKGNGWNEQLPGLLHILSSVTEVQNCNETVASIKYEVGTTRVKYHFTEKCDTE